MNTTCKTASRQSQLPAVSGTARVLRRLGTIPGHDNTAEIAISGKAYLCRCLDHSFELVSLDARRDDVTAYELPADLSSCECLDYLSRSHRRIDGKCKHQKAVAVLVAAGKLPRLSCNPVPRVDDLADVDASLDDSEAEAWHSAYDAA